MFQITSILACFALATAAPDDPCATDGHCHLTRSVSPAPQLSGHFGAAVAHDGGTYLAVGEPGADRVHVYRKVFLTYEHIQTIDCPSGTGADFGRALDLSYARLVVGAPLDDTYAVDGGAAYIYELGGSTFQLVSTVQSHAPTSGAGFGAAVAITTQWAAVGEPSGGVGGRVQVYWRSAGTWGFLESVSGPSGSTLGRALAISGDELVIGDPGDDSFAPNSGAVRVQRMLPVGLTTAVWLFAPTPQVGDAFGRSVALDGGRLVVGSPGEDTVAQNAGAAHVFERETTFVHPFFDYEPLAELLPCRAIAGGSFGECVAIAGDRIAVGARFMGTAGTVYTYERRVIFNETWPVADEMRPADGSVGDQFGFALACDESAVYVGARLVDLPLSNAGALYTVSTTSKNITQGACPCDGLAAHAPFGDGKAGQAGVPQLELLGELVPGETTTVRLTNATPGTLPVLMWGVQPAYLPFDDGFLLMADPNFVLMPMVSGLGVVGKQLTVPEGTCGVIVSLQVMALDPGAGGSLGTAQSNGVLALIGF